MRESRYRADLLELRPFLCSSLREKNGDKNFTGGRWEAGSKREDWRKLAGRSHYRCGVRGGGPQHADDVGRVDEGGVEHSDGAV